jgi:hypothetical protein
VKAHKQKKQEQVSKQIDNIAKRAAGITLAQYPLPTTAVAKNATVEAVADNDNGIRNVRKRPNDDVYEA